MTADKHFEFDTNTINATIQDYSLKPSIEPLPEPTTVVSMPTVPDSLIEKILGAAQRRLAVVRQDVYDIDRIVEIGLTNDIVKSSSAEMIELLTRARLLAVGRLANQYSFKIAPMDMDTKIHGLLGSSLVQPIGLDEEKGVVFFHKFTSYTHNGLKSDQHDMFVRIFKLAPYIVPWPGVPPISRWYTVFAARSDMPRDDVRLREDKRENIVDSVVQLMFDLMPDYIKWRQEQA